MTTMATPTTTTKQEVTPALVNLATALRLEMATASWWRINQMEYQIWRAHPTYDEATMMAGGFVVAPTHPHYVYVGTPTTTVKKQEMMPGLMDLATALHLELTDRKWVSNRTEYMLWKPTMLTRYDSTLAAAGFTAHHFPASNEYLYMYTGCVTTTAPLFSERHLETLERIDTRVGALLAKLGATLPEKEYRDERGFQIEVHPQKVTSAMRRLAARLDLAEVADYTRPIAPHNRVYRLWLPQWHISQPNDVAEAAGFKPYEDGKHYIYLDKLM